MAYYIVNIPAAPGVTQPGVHIVDEAGLDTLQPDTTGITVAVLNLDDRTTITTSPGFAEPSVLSIDDHPSMLNGQPYSVDGYMYPLIGQAQIDALERQVPFAGSAAAAHNGKAVEGRVISTVTGVSLTGWQPLGTVSGGRYAGSMTCPAGKMLRKQVRLATDHSVLAQLDNRFGVGFAVAIEGRSQTAIPVQSRVYSSGAISYVEKADAIPMEPGVFGLVSYLGNADGSSNADGTTNNANTRYGYVGDPKFTGGNSLTHDTLSRIANQWAKFTTEIPLLLLVFAHNSPSPDRPNSIVMMPYATGADLYGQGAVTLACGHGYSSSDVGVPDPGNATSPEDYIADTKAYMQALPYYHDELSFVPTSFVRGQTASEPINSYRAIGSALMNDGAVAPPLPDIRVEGHSDSPHPLKHDKRGTLWQASLYPIAIARALGLDPSRNPYFDDPMFNQDRSAITIRVVPVSGGEIFSTRPAKIVGIRVIDGGVTYNQFDMSAYLSGEYVTLVKNDGSWSSAAKVYQISFGMTIPVPPTGTIEEAETDLAYGSIKETHPALSEWDGITVTGTVNSEGQWVSRIEEVPAAWSNAQEEFPTKESLLAYLDPASGNIGRTSTKPLKVPGVDDMPSGMSFNAVTKRITFSQAAEYELEDWDFRGCYIRAETNSVKAVPYLSQCLFDNALSAAAVSNSAALHLGAGGLGMVENCSFIASGDYRARGIGNPIIVNEAADLGQGVVRKSVFTGWSSDPLTGPLTLVERNLIRPTSMFLVQPEDWDAGTVYAVGDWVMYAATPGGKKFASQCLIANTGNPPTGQDSVSNQWWNTFNPHVDLICQTGTKAGKPSVIQYNLLERSFSGVAPESMKARINAVLWKLSGNVWEVFTRLRKNIILNDPTYSDGGNNLVAMNDSKVICEGNWMLPHNGSYLTNGGGDWRWGYNRNYNTDAIIPPPSSASPWPSA